MTEGIYEHNGWKFLRVAVAQGPLSRAAGKRWCNYFESVLRETRRLRAVLTLGEVGGKGGYHVHDDSKAAYEVLEANRGGDVLFGARGPDANRVLRKVGAIFDAESDFWAAKKREQINLGAADWKRKRLPRRPPPREDWKAVYLRFGGLPADGHSRCYATGAKEPGVCVFRAYETPEGNYLVDLQSRASLACDFFVLERSERPAFVVEGEEVGVGWAGEPALKNIGSCEPVPRDAEIGTTVELPHSFRMWARKTLAQKGYDFDRLPPRFPPSQREKRQSVEDPAVFAGDGFERLVTLVLPHATHTSRRSKIHGPAHWRRVAENGERLCGKTPGADPHVVALFAALHDSCRDNDRRDRLHGHCAAQLSERLLTKGVISANDDQMDRLVGACEWHNKGAISSDPTVGVCFDADRLDLPRCGIQPDARYLSTEAGLTLCPPRRF